MGIRSAILIALSAAASLSVRAQDVVYVPSCEPMVRVLRSAYCSPDDRTRELSISWLRERSTPAAFQILYRAKGDTTAVVRAEAMLGLSEIAPEYQLDAFQMRNLEPTERAALIRRAADEGLIDAVSLRSIATDSSASGIERAQAMQELARLEQSVDTEDWVPLLGVDDERTQLLSALAVVTDNPESRAVALAQDHAIGLLRKSVVDASKGRISLVVSTLREARRAPTEPLADWAQAIMKACYDDTSPEQQLAKREAIRTLLLVAPQTKGLRAQWLKLWNEAGNSSFDRATLAFWAFEAGCLRHDETLKAPAWLAETVRASDTSGDAFLAATAEGLASLAAGQRCSDELLLSIIQTGGVRVRRHTLDLLIDRPGTSCAPTLVSLLTNAESDNLEPWLIRAAAGELAGRDPALAAEQLLSAHSRRDVNVAVALVLAGVWSSGLDDEPRLSLLRSLCDAERMVEGPRSEDRARLADELALIVDEAAGFALPIRAEAAWLAMVLRDQTSEAMAHLPRQPSSLPGDLSPKGEQADSLLQWAQMQYP